MQYKLNQRPISNNTESGSAIIWILMAVALFAALNFAFNSSTRTSISTLDNAEATAYANQIIAYGNEVKSTVKRLMLRGCSDTEISFENAVVAGYSNPNSPTDKSCNVFDIAGGGLSWKTTPNITSNQWLIAEGNKVQGVGTEDAGTVDLILALQNIPDNVCTDINNLLKHSLTQNPPSDGGLWSKVKFSGSYTSTNVIAGVPHGLEGLKAACFKDDIPENVFYVVLIKQ